MNWLKAHYKTFLIVILLAIHAFFLFYQLEKRITFANDQVDNAWAAVRILIEHRYPLVGMVAKANSGIYIGPAYYYLVALFYLLTNFNPIASPLLAGATGIVSFFVLYWVTKKIFSTDAAIWAMFIYVFSEGIITAERVQWPVNFIPMLSYLIFYFLYRILNGSPKHILYLAATIGVFFHIHFTAVFYPIITLAALPFFPWSWEVMRYIIIGLPLFAAFFIPNALYEMQTHAIFRSATSYGATYSHGFHLRRFFQIYNYPYFELNKLLPYPFIGKFVPTLFPIFSAVSFNKKRIKHWISITYLIALWILIPWIIFTFYSGEISDYYFASFRFIAIAMLAYISWKISSNKSIVIKIIPFILWITYAALNISVFFRPPGSDYAERIQKIKTTISLHQKIPFVEGVADSYYYYWLIHTGTKGL